MQISQSIKIELVHDEETLIVLCVVSITAALFTKEFTVEKNGNNLPALTAKWVRTSHACTQWLPCIHEKDCRLWFPTTGMEGKSIMIREQAHEAGLYVRMSHTCHLKSRPHATYTRTVVTRGQGAGGGRQGNQGNRGSRTQSGEGRKSERS